MICCGSACEQPADIRPGAESMHKSVEKFGLLLFLILYSFAFKGN